MLHRRDFHRLGTLILGGISSLVVAIPGVAYLLNPLRAKAKSATLSGYPVGRLSQLEEGVPQSFAIIDERHDAWIKYPREPIGSVWLILQPSTAKDRVAAFTAECPHLGCAVNLAADGKEFKCPCHDGTFALSGKPSNAVPPRGMDPLKVELSKDADPMVYVTFQRFQAQSAESIPIV